jgi:hypothetical protein
MFSTVLRASLQQSVSLDSKPWTATSQSLSMMLFCSRETRSASQFIEYVRGRSLWFENASLRKVLLFDPVAHVAGASCTGLPLDAAVCI